MAVLADDRYFGRYLSVCGVHLASSDKRHSLVINMKWLRRGILAASLALASVLPSYAQSTKATLLSLVNTNFPDNTLGLITPAIARATFDAFINTWQQTPQINPQVGTTYTVQTTDYGNVITFNSASAVTVTLPQATVGNGFSPFNVTLINVGTGVVTVNPQTSTACGFSQIGLVTGGAVELVSDGTNYQCTWMGGNNSSGINNGALSNMNAQTFKCNLVTSANHPSDCALGGLNSPGTTSYTPVQGDYGKIISSALAGGALTITLPTAINAGYYITIASFTNTVTINRGGSQSILFPVNQVATSISLTQQASNITLYFDGANWQVVGGSDLPNLLVNSIPLAALVQATADTVVCNPTASLANLQFCSGGQLSANVLCQPNKQVLTSGTNATYTTPTCNSQLPSYIELEIQGGGGGGFGSGTSPGAAGAGGATCWNTTSPACTTPIYQSGGGAAGPSATGTNAAGGTVTGSGTCSDPQTGGASMGSSGIANTIGGIGGGTFYSQGGVGGAAGGIAGVSPPANTGAGGGGASDAATVSGGAGGGGGATCRTLQTAPAASYVYTIGAAGTGGTAGTSGFAGANGAAGKIVATARWQ